MIDSMKRRAMRQWRVKVTEFETNKEAKEDQISPIWMTRRLTRQQKRSQSAKTRQEDLDGAEETDEEADKEESSVEGASTIENGPRKPKINSEDEEKKPSKIEMMKMEAEHAWKNLEKEPINIEAKKMETEDPWKNLDEVLQTDEEEVCRMWRARL
jgi:hypothetical protein